MTEIDLFKKREDLCDCVCLTVDSNWITLNLIGDYYSLQFIHLGLTFITIFNYFLLIQHLIMLIMTLP